MKHHLKNFNKTGRTMSEMKTFMYIITASALMRDDKMQEAYKTLNEAIALLDEMDALVCFSMLKKRAFTRCGIASGKNLKKMIVFA